MKFKAIKYFALSLLGHGFVLAFLIFSYEQLAPLPVLQNTNRQDVISAVVLGDTPESKILPQVVSRPPPEPKPEKTLAQMPKPPEPKPIEKPQEIKKPVPEIAVKKPKVDAIVLAKEKARPIKKQQQLFAKDLLADIKKHSENRKKVQQKKLKSQFEQTLKQQAEASLRQQLLDEDVRLRNQQARLSQGEINKYKALILQSISEHWIVPSQSDRKRYCELLIRLAPGGMVLDVQVTKTSGDLALDRSARSAVLNASPLPVPKDPKLFAPFRHFVLKVKPENILTVPTLSSSRAALFAAWRSPSTA